ncbi:zinc ribbon domain-containing protein [Streptosporangium sp. NBC_01756]|uniref:zinc ribbon domain-containing protein n=1 Tax=Streptosporangium sp. NBC_01756 TaxID=2975950 RepID=UPI0030887BAA|nr:transposase [Streptosporangium sp. NBC_01756]
MRADLTAARKLRPIHPARRAHLSPDPGRARCTGTHVITVNPAYTSQTCNVCTLRGSQCAPRWEADVAPSHHDAAKSQ